MYLFQDQGDHHLPFVPGQCYWVTNEIELSGGEGTTWVVKGGDTQGRRGTRHSGMKRIVCVLGVKGDPRDVSVVRETGDGIASYFVEDKLESHTTGVPLTFVFSHLCTVHEKQ